MTDTIRPEVRSAIRSARWRSRPAKLLAASFTLACLFVYAYLAGAARSDLGTYLVIAVVVLVPVIAGTEHYLRKYQVADDDLVDRVHDLARRAGLRNLPLVRVASTPTLVPAASKVEMRRRLAMSSNACAADDLTPGSTVLVGTNLLSALHQDEEDAVLAHEISHLAHGMPLVAVIHGAGRLMARFLSVAAVISGVLLAFVTSTPLGPVATLGIVIGLNILRSLVDNFASRVEEHAADRTGSVLCGRPEHLASALVRIQAASTALKAIVKDKSTEPLGERIQRAAAYQEPLAPLTFDETRQASTRPGMEHPFPTGFFATHPATAARIERLLLLTER